MERTRHLFKSSVIVFLLFGFGKLTGLLRVRLVSNEFGTSADFDAFTAANQLPEVFVTLISGGALAAAFIPVYSQYLTSKKAQESGVLASTILTLVIIVLGGLSLIGIIFAPWITNHLLAPRFSPELQQLTADLMRIILIQTTLFGISGVLSSVLNAHQHFALPALAPVALDIGYLIGLIFFVPTMGIAGLAWGTVIGGLLHILIQVPALIRYSFSYAPALALKMSGVREVIFLMFPRIITLGAVQFADLVIIYLTSREIGNTSGYFYGYYLMQLPETLLGTAIAIVVFPTMAELYNAGDLNGLKRTSMSALRIIWTLTIPAAVGMVLLGRPLIELFLGGGAFDAESIQLVYGILVFFSFRVISEASLEILARLFYAQHDTYTPMFVSLFWLVLNIGLAFPLFASLGVRGLALASTIAFTVQAIILFVLNRRRLGSLQERELAASAGRSLLGAAFMTATILLIGRLIDNTYVFMVFGAVFGVLAYFGVTYITGGREIPNLINIVRNRPAK
jgi:putative peptidoglycan lipid II flippase